MSIFHVSQASPIPLILYDVPSRTGVSISNEIIFKLLENMTILLE